MNYYFSKIKPINYKHLFTVFFLFLSLNQNAQSQSKPKIIKLATETWIPFAYKNRSNQPTGFDYDVARAVFTKIGYDLKLEFQPWLRVIDMAKRKEIDGILDVAYNKERSEFLLFPSEHLSTFETVVFSRRADKFEFNLIEDLKGKTVGLLKGYVYPKELTNSKDIKLEYMTGDTAGPRNFLKLLNKRIDVVIENKQVGLNIMKDLEIQSKIVYSRNNLDGEKKLYVGFVLKDELKTVAEQFSEELKKFKNKEEYYKILNKYNVNQ